MKRTRKISTPKGKDANPKMTQMSELPEILKAAIQLRNKSSLTMNRKIESLSKEREYKKESNANFRTGECNTAIEKVNLFPYVNCNKNV